MSSAERAPGATRLTDGDAPADVVIVGGGIMGCASALALADAGVRALVLERAVPGAEASSHAAGILGPAIEARGGASLRLGQRSLALHAQLAERFDPIRLRQVAAPILKRHQIDEAPVSPFVTS